MKQIVLTFLSLLIFQFGNAQGPTPQITGDFFGCGGDILILSVDTFTAGNTYDWSVTPDAMVLSQLSGNVYIELPDTSEGTFILTLTETDGMSQTATVTQILEIEQNHSLTCDDNLNVSLNDFCYIDISPDVLLEGNPYPNESYSVVVTTLAGDTIPPFSNALPYIGEQLKVSITHDCSGNSCWGRVRFEDKVPPTIECPDDMVVSCFDDDPILPPLAFDNCGIATVVTLVSNVLDASECTGDFAAVRKLTYVAEDEFGNVSQMCMYTISYAFENIDSLTKPRNYDDIDLPALTCDNDPFWDTNGNGYPDVEETGYPTLNGNPIKMTGNGLCKINLTYTDDTLVICDAAFKVLRNWTILDWCTGKVITCIQIIKVLDRFGPVIVCAADFTQLVYTRPYECLADFPVPAPQIIFECSDSISYTVEYLLANDQGQAPQGADIEYITDNVESDGDGGYIIRDLPKGFTWLKYTVFDGCGNSTECYSELYVEDNKGPIPVCDQNTVVGLNSVNFAQVFAITFDDGSLDNCEKTYFEVARMQSGCGVGTGFGKSAIFCCDDIGRDLQVQLRVWDDANCNGIFGDEIDVFLDSNNNGIIGDAGDRFVRRVADNSNVCMVNVEVQDKADPVITCPKNTTVDCLDPYDEASTGGPATATDNCPGVMVELTNTNENLNQCKIGSVTRTYVATDASGRTASCNYKVTIINDSPFNERDINWNTVPDVFLEGCMGIDTDPDKTGRPTWTADGCAMVASSYDDEFFTIQDSVCAKILRKWSIIDWCTFNEDTGEGLYTYVQVIKINNSVDPVFDNCRNIKECAFSQDCDEYIELIIGATDDCTPIEDLNFLYTIDLDNDGSIDRPGGSNDLSGTFDVGMHKIVISVTDGCGNRSDCEFILTVEDCKEPTPYCFTEITTVIMPSTGIIDIWATDFDNGSFDNCTNEEDLRFAFSSIYGDDQRFFDCDDLGQNELELWVSDEAGNQDFCIVKVDIQANGDACEDIPRISGKVNNEANEAMANVEIILTDETNNVTSSTTTNDNGSYMLAGQFNSSNEYTIRAAKDVDYMNGVSTLDLVLIQRHILGIDKFTSPYSVIAADINNTNSITAGDLVALRKLILGIDAEFTSNSSWRFPAVDQDYPDVLKPWPFEEAVTVDSGQTGEQVIDFMGVKIGDVNLSAKANVRSGDVGPRSEDPMVINVLDQSFESDELVKIELVLDADYELFGLQNTFKFDLEALEFVGIESGVLEMTEGNIGLQAINEGMITASWSSSELQELSSGDVIFSVFFKAHQYSSVVENFEITSDMTTAEVYNKNFTPSQIEVNYRSIAMSNLINVYQNSPNPFTDKTTIAYEINKATDVNLIVHDMSGKVLYKTSKYSNAGYNEFVINVEQLRTQGIVTYTLESSLGSVTKKMVILE